MPLYCYICKGRSHQTSECTFPNYLHQCSRCFVVSLDEGSHLQSSFRRNVYGSQPVVLFKIRLENSADWIKVFDAQNGSFDVVRENTSFISPATEGLFELKSDENGKQMVSYSAVSIKRFSVLVAVFANHKWRFRLRIVLTEDRGILCFPMRTTFDTVNGKHMIPEGFRYNTPLILGIGTTGEQSTLRFKISASTNGIVVDTEDQFNGYYGLVNWFRNRLDPSNDYVEISPELSQETAELRKFANCLYESNGPITKIHNVYDQIKAAEQKFKDDEALAQTIRRIISENQPKSVNATEQSISMNTEDVTRVGEVHVATIAEVNDDDSLPPLDSDSEF